MRWRSGAVNVVHCYVAPKLVSGADVAFQNAISGVPTRTELIPRTPHTGARTHNKQAQSKQHYNHTQTVRASDQTYNRIRGCGRRRISERLNCVRCADREPCAPRNLRLLLLSERYS